MSPQRRHFPFIRFPTLWDKLCCELLYHWRQTGGWCVALAHGYTDCAQQITLLWWATGTCKNDLETRLWLWVNTGNEHHLYTRMAITHVGLILVLPDTAPPQIPFGTWVHRLPLRATLHKDPQVHEDRLTICGIPYTGIQLNTCALDEHGRKRSQGTCVLLLAGLVRRISALCRRCNEI